MNAPDAPASCAFWLATPPPTGQSAIAVIELRGDVDSALRALGVAPVVVGASVLRDVGGLDRALVARWSAHAASVMAHAGPVVVESLLALMAQRGLRVGQGAGDPRAAYPEAETEIEARMLDALARAASPLVVDVLLAQPARWAMGSQRGFADGRALGRLIDPPLVAAVGRPNIGKSTLLNALAGRGVALVHDAPGTTRDYVGCMVDLGGLVVRWLDTPGLEDDPREPIQREAQAAARRAAASADLVLLCCDAMHETARVETGAAIVLRVGLRADLGVPLGTCDVRVCARSGEGVAELVGLVREALVPRSVLEDERPWCWW